MKKVIISAAVLALGLGVPPVLAASHSGSASGHNSGKGAGHRMSASPLPEGSDIGVANSGSVGATDTPTCPNNPHMLVCPQ
jgi:hypothetical protein